MNVTAGAAQKTYGVGGSSGRGCRGTGRRAGGHSLGDSDLLVHSGRGSTSTGVGPDQDDLCDTAGTCVDDGSTAGTRSNTGESTSAGTRGSTLLVIHSPLGGVDIVDGFCESQGRDGQVQSC